MISVFKKTMALFLFLTTLLFSAACSPSGNSSHSSLEPQPEQIYSSNNSETDIIDLGAVTTITDKDGEAFVAPIYNMSDRC